MTEGPWELPEGWHWARIGEVTKVNPRKPRMQRPNDAPTSFVPMRAVDEHTGSIAEMETRPYREVRKGYTYFEEGDVLFAKITPCMQNGKAVIARDLIDGLGFGTTEFHVLRPGPKVTAEWIHRYVRRAQFRRQAQQRFRGAVGQQRVPADFVEEAPIPVPPVAEQQRVLAKIDAIVERTREAKRLRESAINDVHQLPAAVIRSSVPQQGHELPDGWQMAPLRRVCQETERCNPRRNPGMVFTYVEISSISPATGRIDATNVLTSSRAPSRARKVIREGDVLVATTRPYLRKIAIVPKELDGEICTTGLCVLRPDPELLEPEWLYFICRSDEFIDELCVWMRGASYPAVTDEDVLDMQIPLPPLPEQRRLLETMTATRRTAIDLWRSMRTSAERFQALEESVLERAFRGEL